MQPVSGPFSGSRRRSTSARHLLVGFATLACGCSPLLAATATVSSTTERTFQGWGFTPSWVDSEGSVGDSGRKWHTLQSYVTGSGWVPRPDVAIDGIYSANADFARFDIPGRISPSISSGVPAWNTQTRNDLAFHVRTAKNRGLSYVLSVWSLPAYMLEDPDGNGKATLKPEYCDGEDYDYADYLIDVIKYLRDTQSLGAPIALSVENEPNYSEGLNAAFFPESDTTRGHYREVIKQVRAKLNSNSMTNVALLGPETSSYGSLSGLLGTPTSSGYQALIDYPDYKDALTGYAFHSYSQENPYANGQAMRAIPKDAWHLEWSNDVRPDTENENTWLLNTVKWMGSDLINMPASRWSWWLGMHQNTTSVDDESLVNVSGSTLYMTRHYWMLKKLWTTVRPGWKVKQVSVSGDADINGAPSPSTSTFGANVDIFAFEDAGGNSSAVLVANDRTSDKTAFTINGLKGSFANVFRSTSGGENMANVQNLPVVNGAITVTIPAQGILFIETTSTGASRYVWTGVSGTTLYNPTSSPNISTRLTSLESIEGVDDNYLENIEGYIVAPVSGTYHFWVAGDDSFSFSLSTTDSRTNLQQKVNLSTPTSKHGWNENAAQKFSVTLSAGSAYFFKAQHKEGTGGNHFAVAWTKPGQYAAGTTPAYPREVIPGSVLLPATNVGSGAGLKGEYFPNKTLTSAVLTRTDPRVEFSWSNAPTNTGGTAISSMPSDGFSVRWTGKVQAQDTGNYQFQVQANDGSRLWVNNILVIDKWLVGSNTASTGSINLTAGQQYDVKMEYFDETGSAWARLYWKRPGSSSQIIVPQSQLFPAP